MTYQEEKNGGSESSELQLGTFYIGGLRFGVDILEIQEINRQRDLTLVPHTAKQVRGVINLRGEVVSVLDLGTVLGLGEIVFGQHTRNIVLHSGDELVGVLVDRLSDVVAINPNDLQPPPANISGVDARFMVGVHQLADELIVVLKIEELLAPPETASATN
jgi:purine-binding chemotaxis protein CheW